MTDSQKDTKQPEQSSTQPDTVYCPANDTIHPDDDSCHLWHMAPERAPDWEEIRFGEHVSKICRRCNYVESCRCFWCGRCGQLCSNKSQGHYWTYCSETKTMRTPHFCCPGQCELEEDNLA